MTRDEAITEITLRLVEYYPTERVFCFGSHSQYESSPYSDLDFCVLVPGDASVEIFQDGGIYSLLRGIGYPKDTVPLHRSDFDARAMRVGLQRAGAAAQKIKAIPNSATIARID